MSRKKLNSMQMEIEIKKCIKLYAHNFFYLTAAKPSAM